MPRLPSSDSISADSSPNFISARPAMPVDLEIVAAAENVLAQKSARVGVGDRLLHNLQQISVLAADVDVSGVRAGRQCRRSSTPSMTACGSCSKISRSLQVPGSLSSPLHRMYFGFADCLGTNDHFIPVLNPGAAASAQAGILHLD